ncbi:heme-responsive histidine kinase [Corynebacterium renale]|uniref:sensor histidine kinase n=1 Tax=Corynebacterium renale TaxID=1724 RepID=UPI000DA41D76|nr:ATP-binding protein [Corynebacterium renale]SQG63996.1 heme-responsive histidine kinase [Corynebacterium renale]STD03493.1 heme-responsive histidine kinase [Corynebacterium renale]
MTTPAASPLHDDPSGPFPSLPQILRISRGLVHAMFIVLFFIAVVTDPQWPALFLGAWYCLVCVQRRVYPPGVRWAWWAVLAVLWAWCVALSSQYLWLLFPIVIYAMGVGRCWWSRLVAAAASWAVVLIPATTPAQVIGPAIGTVVAILGFGAYEALRREAEYYSDLARRLQATQHQLVRAETEAAREAERSRWSREVHDTLAQGFNSIVLFAQAEQAQPGTQAQRIEAIARENLKQARALVQGKIRTSKLEELARGAGDHGVEVTISGEAPQELQEPIERIVREALNNVVKHSGATHAQVTITPWPEAVSVDIHDNGCGWDGSEGTGITGMRARVAEVGGRFSIESTDGTTVSAYIPRRAHD